MTSLKITLGTWNRRRRNAAGKLIRQKRHTINYRCPETGGRVRRSFATRAAAEAVRTQYAGGKYFNPIVNPTVSDAVEHWMSIKAGQVKAQTLRCYATLLKTITGPLLQGTAKERVHYAQTGEKAHRDAKLLKMLGGCKVSELTTAQLRQWHNLVRDEVGEYTANEVMGMLKSILALAEEDFAVPVCKMPTNLARRKHKPKRDILTTAEVTKLLSYAQTDRRSGIHVAFPFLTGMRASEQLGLLWEDIDFGRSILTVRRVLERDGSSTDQTKTEAGQREIPISPTLRRMLLDWWLLCPRLDGQLYRVFAGPGREQPWPLPRKGAGGPILYSNFLHRYWQPAFAKAGVRYVSHHSARHGFVSTLQAQGVEVGLVAKLACHANPSVTLGHYTQAVHGGAAALAVLDAIYTNPSPERIKS